MTGSALRSTPMKNLVPIMALFVCVGFASAEDALMEGGRSPDGSYEVRISRALREPSDYAIQLHRAAVAKPFFTFEGTGGIHQFDMAVSRCRAIWHPSGRFVVVTDQGTKHSQEI